MNRSELETDLKSALTVLTRTHLEHVRDDDHMNLSATSIQMVAPLIDQLREAVVPAKRGGAGGAAGYGTKPPLNVSAVSLLREVGDFVKGYPGATVEDQYDFLVGETIEAGTDKEVQTLLRELTSYNARIRQLLYGKRRKLRLACPSCSQSYVLDGEGVREMCLEFCEGYVECKCCGANWHALDLARMLNNF